MVEQYKHRILVDYLLLYTEVNTVLLGLRMHIYTGFLISVGLASGVRAGTQKLGNFCLLLLLLGKSSYCITEDKSSFATTPFEQ